MDPKRKIRSVDELIDHLSDAFAEAAAENEEVLREELRKDGYDYDALSKEGLAFVKSLQGEDRLRKANRKREALLDLIKRLGSQAGETSAQRGGNVKQWLKEWFGSGGNENNILQAFYSKLEFIDDQDIESLAEDAEILDLLDQYGHTEGSDKVDS